MANSNKPTIEERLQAITQTLELLAHEHIMLEGRHAKLAKIVDDISLGAARLLHIAEIHEKRIEDLEGHKDI